MFVKCCRTQQRNKRKEHYNDITNHTNTAESSSLSTDISCPRPSTNYQGLCEFRCGNHPSLPRYACICSTCSIIRLPARQSKGELKGVKLPLSKIKEKKEVTAYTPEEVAAIVEEAKRTYSNGVPVYRYGYLIILILNTGMREGEPLYLKWKDVNLEKRRIYIHGDVVEVKNREENAESNYICIEQEILFQQEM